MADAIQYFQHDYTGYCPDYLLTATFTETGKLMLRAKPTVDLEVIIREFRDELLELVNFEQHLDIYLYKLGENGLIEISIN